MLPPCCRARRSRPTGPGRRYRDAQLTFDKVIPGQTTDAELRDLKLHPDSNANVVHPELLRHRAALPAELVGDDVRPRQRGEILHRRQDRLHRLRDQPEDREQEPRRATSRWTCCGFHRETETTGWKFNGLVLVKKGTAIYTLTGGQPQIKEHEENTSVLGPVQGLSQKLFGF